MREERPLTRILISMLTRRSGQRVRLRSRVRSVRAILGSLAAILSAVACHDSSAPPTETVDYPYIVASPSSSTVAVGDSVRLLVTTVGALVGAPVPSIGQCISSAPAVASVTSSEQSCTVTGKSLGQAVITISVKSGLTAAASVTVVK